MRDLFESKDLLSEPKVVAAYRGLMNDKPCDECCIAAVAFKMRNAAIRAGLWDDFVEYLHVWFVDGSMISPDTTISGIACPGPEHWIVAATLSWESK